MTVSGTDAYTLNTRHSEPADRGKEQMTESGTEAPDALALMCDRRNASLDRFSRLK
jgi:hypothetical protein